MSLPLSEALNLATNRLTEAGIPDAAHDAKELYMFQAGLDSVGFMMHWSDVLKDNMVDRYMELIDRRAAHEPLQYITGSQQFMNYKIEVNENALIPRQDTETVVQEAIRLIRENKGGSVLDLCTGSGVIAIAIAGECKEAKVSASDISKEALELAAKNASKNHVKVSLTESDMFAKFKSGLGTKKFDFIVSNPPYIETAIIPTLDPEVKDYEPTLALDGGEDGLEFYRIIAKHAPEHLKKRGQIILEIGYDQGESVPRIFSESGCFENIRVLKDLAGLDRIVTARLADKKKDKRTVEVTA